MMETVTFSVPDISCEHCQTSIEGATRELSGVQKSEVDIPGKSVTVQFDPATVDTAQIVTAIEDQGYDVAP